MRRVRALKKQYEQKDQGTRPWVSGTGATGVSVAGATGLEASAVSRGRRGHFDFAVSIAPVASAHALAWAGARCLAFPRRRFILVEADAWRSRHR